MTVALQGAFVVATLLNLTLVVVIVRQLVGAGRERDFPTGMAVLGALLFCASMYSVAIVVGHLGDRLAADDTLLYAGVFGLAAGALAYFGQASEGEHRQRRSREALRFLALALPIGSGLIAGLVGTV